MRRGQFQPLLQINLSRGGVQQIGSSDDMGNALQRIINHYRQLISKQTIGPPDDKVADFF